MIFIWCLFDAYLMLIWWLFVTVVFGDFSWLFDVYLIIIIEYYYWWLFDDHSISAPAAGCLVCFISKILCMEQWHILVMSAFPLGILQPASFACYLLKKLRFICNNNLVFHGCFDEPSALPHSAQHPSARGSGPSHHAKSDGILHPDHESLLQWSCLYSPMCSQGSHYRL